MAEQETAIGKEYNPNKHADPESLGYKRPKMAAEGEVDHIPTPPNHHENRHINPATMGSPMPDGRYPDKLANRKLSPYGTTEPKDEIPEKKGDYGTGVEPYIPIENWATNRIGHAKDVMSKDVCDKLIELGKSSGKWDLTYQSEFGLPDVETLVFTEDWIYEHVWPWMTMANKEFGWGLTIDGCEDLRLVRLSGYNEHGHANKYYSWHTDGPGDSKSRDEEGKVRKLTMEILLNHSSEFKGGEFEYLSYRYSRHVNKIQGQERGDMVIFPAYIDRRILEISEGTRYSLVCRFTGPPIT